MESTTVGSAMGGSSLNLAGPAAVPEYTLAGVLHYLQAEWRQHERERNECEIAMAEMKARIAFLEGERRGNEMAKSDLMRRVRMLEYALKQERKKYLAAVEKKESDSLKGGMTRNNDSSSAQDLAPEHNASVSITSEPSKTAQESPNVATATTDNNQAEQRASESSPTKIEAKNIFPQANPAMLATYGKVEDGHYRKRSRQILELCLDELNQLMATSSQLPEHNNHMGSDTRHIPSTTQALSPIGKSRQMPSESTLNLPERTSKMSGPPTQSKFFSLKDTQFNNETVPGTSSPILRPPSSGSRANAELALSPGPSTPRLEGPNSYPQVKPASKIPNLQYRIATKTPARTSLSNVTTGDTLNAEEDKLTELSGGGIDASVAANGPSEGNTNLTGSDNAEHANGSDDLFQEISETATKSTDSLQTNEHHRMWRTKYSLRSHLDSVRSTILHPTEMLVASGSDDGTVKLWNLTKDAATMSKKALQQDVEPNMTYRGHESPILSLAMEKQTNRIFSGGLDATIRVWQIPQQQRDIYAPMDSSAIGQTYIGHSGAIWDLQFLPGEGDDATMLVSASADGTVKLWDTKDNVTPLRSSFTAMEKHKDPANPTSVSFRCTDVKKILVGYNNSNIHVFDIETGQIITSFTAPDTDGTQSTQINALISHPTLPLFMTGHEDRQIRFYNLDTGKCIFTMQGHLDAVTSLDIDASGSHLVSGGHDASIRIWDIGSTSRPCIQEFTGHRKKCDEGVTSVRYHKSLPWLVSGGADGIVKLYQHMS
ncbi:hypothetical protein BZG36_04192 [Bifiguratus adelaidae]|uniref:Striatin N-terminal domain-containing protein n=1 Tax=Bifiguratus adelaidae TaxID=1938954 RepID=A0A261XW24_9FUNG|nr:hypothetical protein BZG36_04192 [Bifiguratus adelaidae]